MHPREHAQSSARKWGGRLEDYLPIHDWFDESKSHLPDIRHRALRHHAQGIFWAEEVFGHTIANSAGKEIPVRYVGEQHVKEDLGRIPIIADWFRNLTLEPWMLKGGRDPEISVVFDGAELLHGFIPSDQDDPDMCEVCGRDRGYTHHIRPLGVTRD